MLDQRDGTNIYQMVDIIDDNLRSKRRDAKISEGLPVFLFAIFSAGILLAIWCFVKIAKSIGKEGAFAFGLSTVWIIVLVWITYGTLEVHEDKLASDSHATSIGQSELQIGDNALPMATMADNFSHPATSAKKTKVSFAPVKREVPSIPNGLFISPALRSLLGDPDGFYVAQAEYRTLRKEVERTNGSRLALEQNLNPADLAKWQRLTSDEFMVPGYGCIFEWQSGVQFKLPD